MKFKSRLAEGGPGSGIKGHKPGDGSVPRRNKTMSPTTNLSGGERRFMKSAVGQDYLRGSRAAYAKTPKQHADALMFHKEKAAMYSASGEHDKAAAHTSAAAAHAHAMNNHKEPGASAAAQRMTSRATGFTKLGSSEK